MISENNTKQKVESRKPDEWSLEANENYAGKENGGCGLQWTETNDMS